MVRARPFRVTAACETDVGRREQFFLSISVSFGAFVHRGDHGDPGPGWVGSVGFHRASVFVDLGAAWCLTSALAYCYLA